MSRKMNRFEALSLSSAVLEKSGLYFVFDDDTGLVTSDSFRLTGPKVDFLPEEYAIELTNIANEYNKRMKELALKIVDDYEDVD